MNCYKSFLRQIAEIEADTFSDKWTYESIEDSLQYDYNTVLILIMDEKNRLGFNLYKAGGLVEPYIDFQEMKARCVGYVISAQVAEETELLRIAVQSGFRGKKLGEKLLKEYLKYISKDCEKAFLEVRESNEIAKALYEKMGYVNIAKRKGYYSNPSEDGIIYEYIPNNPS